MPQRYNTGNSRPSNSMKDLNDNALAFDDFMNSESDTFIDRFGDPKDSLPGTTKKIMLAADDVIEATRQNLIPLSRQYMTLAAAQADIANIPDGSATYVRSSDGSSLADEYINNAGTLEATGRKMPSQAVISTLGSEINKINETVIRNLDVTLPDGRKIIIALTDENGNSNLFIDDRGANHLGGVIHDTSGVIYDPFIIQVRTDQNDLAIERVFKSGHVLTGLGYAPATPAAVYQLNPIGIYLADNVTLNPDAPAIRAIQLKDLNDFNLGLTGYAMDCLTDNDHCSGAAAAEWLYDWAMRRSLILASTTGTSGLFERQWRVGNIAISYMLVKGSVPVPLRAEILSWITEVGTAMIADFDSKYGATKNNNHAYWVAAALYACYVVTDNTDFRDFALTIYDQAMGRIQANGTISSEMDRASRVLYYHNFAIEPLIMICELAIRKGEDVYGRNSKLFSMIETTIHGIVDPAWFKTNAGLTYDQEAITGLGWCAFVALRYPEIDQGRLNSDLSVYVDQFFMGKTYLLAQQWVN
ncbi:alginate lyase family protein [Klebsiella pneumoniae]|uniref:alginate lyase family protein n=1 Tax=Klebsiella pneumoniae TaxID=573 RepID=UPI003EBCE317